MSLTKGEQYECLNCGLEIEVIQSSGTLQAGPPVCACSAQPMIKRKEAVVSTVW